MSRILSSDSKFMLFLSKFFDIVILSILFLMCCLPVVTIGPALSALYSTTRKVVLRREGYIVKEYFHSFRINFLTGLGVWLILFLITVLMGINIFYAATTWKNAFGIMAMAIYFAVLCGVFVLCGYIFPILSRFECKGKQLFINAVSIALSHLKTSIGLLLLQIAFYFLLVYSYAGIPILLFFLPVGFAALQQGILERIFAEYTESEKEVVSNG